MTDASGAPLSANASAADQLAASNDLWTEQLGSLLRELQEVATAGRPVGPAAPEGEDSRLAEVRLGIAGSLFAALRCKHPAIAGHSLRVALACSAWAARMGLPAAKRDAIELAALLHDIGVIGAPDSILLKPGHLTAEEAEVMARARTMSLDILRPSCSSPEVLEIVANVGAWYDGSRKGFARHGAQIPLGARMIAIAEAFDSMTTDHVYRPAMSQERALAELFDCAGSQFDPELVQRFAELAQGDPSQWRREVADRWLHSLDPQAVNAYWTLNRDALGEGQHQIGDVFHGRLLENMYDAVVFIDATGRVILWNRGAERLTGIAGSTICGRQWTPDLLQMADEKGTPLADQDCPVSVALHSGVQSLRRLTVRGRTGRSVAVDTHTIPVISAEGVMHGAVLLLHDVSSEMSLEQRCQILYEKATKDPLTQVANRAEFDRVHAMFVEAHRQQSVPCSLIICDLDRFKQVNDTYGHQAGDEVIQSLASLLKSSCRPGDLVARYGGEEFVVLCADCDNATAARRADQIREAFSRIPQPKMNGRTVTASFGVTEAQPGDTPETMLRRADRALLMAKAKGRNCVVQLGAGAADGETAAPAQSLSCPVVPEMLEQRLVTPVPARMAVEKLRGFIADHQARAVRAEGNRIRLQLDDQNPSRLRRLTDRPVTFELEVRFDEQRHQGPYASAGSLHTRIHVCIRPLKSRDRRRNDVMARAREVLVSLRAYLMATEEEPLVEKASTLSRARRWIWPWRRRE